MRTPLDVIRSRRTLMHLVALVFAGVLTASCSVSPSAAPPTTTQPPGQVTGGKTATTSTTTTTTTTTQPGPLPGCGSPRDPLDPTDSPPPAGSPADC
jgi:hypothetical protein